MTPLAVIHSLFLKTVSYSDETLFGLNKYLETNIPQTSNNSNTDSPFAQLPIDILSSIGKYLNHYESIYVFGFINREFYVITQTVSFFKDRKDRILSVNSTS